MKSIVKVIAFMVVAALAITGCQNLDEQMEIIVSQAATEEVSSDEVDTEEQDTEEQDTEEQNTEKKDMVKQDTEEATVEDSMDQGDDIYKAYQEIMDKYIELNSQNTTYEECQSLEFPYEVAEGLYKTYNVLLVGGDLSTVGYAIEDIDGDGVKELILANFYTSQIYDMYTMDSNTPKLVAASAERSSTYYCGDHFCVEGSGGAANFIISKSHFVGEKMQSEYYIYTDQLNDGEVAHFFTTNQSMDKENDEQLSRAEYDYLKEDAESGMSVFPELTPLVGLGKCAE